MQAIQHDWKLLIFIMSLVFLYKALYWDTPQETGQQTTIYQAFFAAFSVVSFAYYKGAPWQIVFILVPFVLFNLMRGGNSQHDLPEDAVQQEFLRMSSTSTSENKPRVFPWKYIIGIFILYILLRQYLQQYSALFLAVLAGIFCVIGELIKLLHSSQRPEPVTTKEKARDVLGVSAHATKEEILDAHRLTIEFGRSHGLESDFTTRRIDQARDFLLKHSDSPP